MSERIIDLDLAIYEIIEAMKERINPFFFIVGAGISADSVPLASEIIKMCKKKVESSTFIQKNEVTKNNSTEEYSYWLERAYPHSISRQRLFRELIEGKNITSANFRLAHILANSELSNIVVTPNFDDFLIRALNLFNVKHIVCDHPETAFKVNLERKDIQIVHVHGTYLSYDCCNLTPEINNRSKISNTTSNTIAALFERISETISPIVIGYSGWENDVIMTSLEKRLNSNRLPFNLYWFLYDFNDLHKLPKWLRTHSDVVFVSINENQQEINSPEEEAANNTVLDDFNNYEDSLKRNFSEVTSNNKLAAITVFDRLINELNVKEPLITEDPIEFLINFIGGESDNNSKPQDIFFLSHVIERLKNLKELENKSAEVKDVNIDLFKNIRKFARTSKYKQAAMLLQQLEFENFPPYLLLELVEVILSIMVNIDYSTEENCRIILSTINYYENVIPYINEIKDNAKFINGSNIVIYKLKFGVYSKLNEVNEMLSVLQDIRNYYTTVDLNYFEITKAIYNRALILEKSDKNKAESELESILPYFKIIEDQESTKFLYYACHRLIVLNKKDNNDKAIKYCDIMIENNDLLGEVASAHGLYQKILILEEMNDSELEYNIRKFVNSFSESKETEVQSWLINVYFLQILSMSIENPKYLEYSNLIIKKFKNHEDEEILISVGAAYSNKGYYYYFKHDVLSAIENYELALDFGYKESVVNLYYIWRKEEKNKRINAFNHNEMFMSYVDNKDIFALMNYALYQWETEGEWEEADKIISDFKNFSEKEIKSLLSWWNDLAQKGDDEGHLVIAWLTMHDLIEDPNSLEQNSRLKKITNQNKIPDFMYSS